MSRIINGAFIEFSGVVLPVLRDDSGHAIVPLKPITDVFGLQWERQRTKLKPQKFRELLGVCVAYVPHAGRYSQGREMVCLHVDKVILFIKTIGPARMRGQGNIDGAEALTSKWNEWVRATYDYGLRYGIFTDAVPVARPGTTAYSRQAPGLPATEGLAA